MGPSGGAFPSRDNRSSMARPFSARQIGTASARLLAWRAVAVIAATATERLTHVMRVSKFEHAALRLDLNGQTLLIDPGSFTTPPDDLSGLVGVVLTHEHPDHWTPEQLDRILRAAPGTPVYGPEGSPGRQTATTSRWSRPATRSRSDRSHCVSSAAPTP